MTQVPIQLSYAQPRKRRRVWRYVLAVLLVGLVWAGWRWYTPIRARCETLYWQRRCERYTAPPDFVVYESDVIAGNKLLSSGRGYKSFIGRNPDPGTADFWYVPPESSHFATLRWEPGPAFMHERASPDGNRHLVTTVTGGTAGHHARPITLFCRTLRPTWDGLEYETSSGGISIIKGGGERLTLFAGQPDPDNESHFTIHYIFAGQPGTIDGWVRNGGKVILAPRAGHYCKLGYGTSWRPPGSTYPSSSRDIPVVPMSMPLK